MTITLPRGRLGIRVTFFFLQVCGFLLDNREMFVVKEHTQLMKTREPTSSRMRACEEASNTVLVKKRWISQSCHTYDVIIHTPDGFILFLLKDKFILHYFQYQMIKLDSNCKRNFEND